MILNTVCQEQLDDIKIGLANKSDIGHNHDDRYYTESEINTKLSNKQDSATAINTGNIANQSVKYATSAGSAGSANKVPFSGLTNMPSDIIAIKSVAWAWTIASGGDQSSDQNITAISGYTPVACVGWGTSYPNTVKVYKAFVTSAGKLAVYVRNEHSASLSVTCTFYILYVNNSYGASFK